jgi:hypothetical protein
LSKKTPIFSPFLSRKLMSQNFQFETEAKRRPSQLGLLFIVRRATPLDLMVEMWPCFQISKAFIFRVWRVRDNQPARYICFFSSSFKLYVLIRWQSNYPKSKNVWFFPTGFSDTNSRTHIHSDTRLHKYFFTVITSLHT